jgi:hypothetical protein
MRHLRAFIYDRNILSNWQEYLPWVQRICNAARNEANATGADQLLFGNAIRLDRGIFLPHRLPHDVQVTLSTWAATMLKTQDELLKIAKVTQKKRDLDHLVKADIRRTDYPVGSFVLCDYHKKAFRKGPPNKLLTYLRGPMKVISSDKNTYKLENLITRKFELIHVTDIHPFNYDENHEQPKNVARRDITSSFEVREILEHAGDIDKRSTLDFFVSWVGLEDTENLWLPYSELRDNSVLHDYLRLNGLEKLIPKKFGEPLRKKVGKKPKPHQALAAKQQQGTRNTRSNKTPEQQMDIEQE